MLDQKLYNVMQPLSNRVQQLARYVDQLIHNVDKHEDQVDVIEQALFGRSRNEDYKQEESKQEEADSEDNGLKELSNIREDYEMADGSQMEQDDPKISCRATPKNLIDQIFNKVNEFQVQSS